MIYFLYQIEILLLDMFKIPGFQVFYTLIVKFQVFTVSGNPVNIKKFNI